MLHLKICGLGITLSPFRDSVHCTLIGTSPQSNHGQNRLEAGFQSLLGSSFLFFAYVPGVPTGSLGYILKPSFLVTTKLHFFQHQRTAKISTLLHSNFLLDLLPFLSCAAEIANVLGVKQCQGVLFALFFSLRS